MIKEDFGTTASSLPGSLTTGDRSTEQVAGRAPGSWYDTGRNAARFGMTYCACCEREFVDENNAVRMLELDQRTGTYHDFGDVPEDKSQGWFAFGLTCARKLVKQEKDRRAALSKATGAQS